VNQEVSRNPIFGLVQTIIAVINGKEFALKPVSINSYLLKVTRLCSQRSEAVEGYKVLDVQKLLIATQKITDNNGYNCLSRSQSLYQHVLFCEELLGSYNVIFYPLSLCQDYYQFPVL
jgi:hypothetical protein